MVTPEQAAELARQRAVQRLPADVREVLGAAGWRPGRDISDRLRHWLDRLHRDVPAAGARLPIFDAAFTALAEFGALKFTQLSRVGYAGGGFEIEVWPDVGRVVVDLYAEFAADIGVAVFPFAWYSDGPSDAAIAADGRVFLLHPVGEFLLGSTVDEALTALVRGPDLIPVDDHGTPLCR